MLKNMSTLTAVVLGLAMTMFVVIFFVFMSLPPIYGWSNSVDIMRDYMLGNCNELVIEFCR